MYFVALLFFIAYVIAEDPDVGKSMIPIVESKGYKIESYNVTTLDGFILGMFRIPPKTAGAPVVLLQHGLLDSSWTWVNNFPSQSLGFVLADAGYDVWFGNSRGNYYSLHHVKYPVNSDQFWNFTYDDMAAYDLPAQVSHALSISGRKTLTYVGHSQGVMQGFAGFSINSTLCSQVNLFVALAPAVYISHAQGLLAILADLDVDLLFQFLGVQEFLPDATLLQRLAPGFCEELDWACADLLFWLAGKTQNLNETRIPVYVSETPAGTSVKNMVHWAQAVRGENFQKYDYGEAGNELHYGQKTPPKYDLSKFTVPSAIYYGGLDILASPQDVHHLLSTLPPQVIVDQRETSFFAHIDYSWAQNARTYVYNAAIQVISKYNK